MNKNSCFYFCSADENGFAVERDAISKWIAQLLLLFFTTQMVYSISIQAMWFHLGTCISSLIKLHIRRKNWTKIRHIILLPLSLHCTVWFWLAWPAQCFFFSSTLLSYCILCPQKPNEFVSIHQTIWQKNVWIFGSQSKYGWIAFKCNGFLLSQPFFVQFFNFFFLLYSLHIYKNMLFSLYFWCGRGVDCYQHFYFAPNKKNMEKICKNSLSANKIQQNF